MTVLVPVLVAMDDRYVDFIFDKFGCPVGDMLDASRPARRMDAVGAVSSIAAPITRQHACGAKVAPPHTEEYIDDEIYFKVVR